jgi:hypothetical protein
MEGEMRDAHKNTLNDQKLALEVWKHFASIGGDDKARMIQIVTWLLAFSAGIIGLYATGRLKQAIVPLFLVGILISVLAAFTALLYGGYAAWNWAIADQIAKDHNWQKQKPDYVPFENSQIPWSVWLAKPCQNGIAPVFWLFFGGSVLSLGVHLWLLSRVWPGTRSVIAMICTR